MSVCLSNYMQFCSGRSIDSIISKNNDGNLPHFPYNSCIGINELDISHIYKIRNIEGLLNYSDKDLEDDHSFIQWMFPTPRMSQFNENSPVLSKQEITILKLNTQIINILQKFKDKMFEYWGIVPYNKDRLPLLNGHNGLRLSRVIECLTLFGIDIAYIFPILEENIKDRTLRPYHQSITHHGRTIEMPIWFIRYYENLN